MSWSSAASCSHATCSHRTSTDRGTRRTAERMNIAPLRTVRRCCRRVGCRRCVRGHRVGSRRRRYVACREAAVPRWQLHRRPRHVLRLLHAGRPCTEGGRRDRRRCDRGLRHIGSVVERPNTYGAGTGVTYVAEELKVVWERLVVESGASVLLHAFVQDVVVNDGRITDLIVATKAGLRRLEASMVVDASGDADVCHQAGFGYETAGSIDPGTNAHDDVPHGECRPRSSVRRSARTNSTL